MCSSDLFPVTIQGGAQFTPGPWEWQRGERYLKLNQRNAPHESVIPPCDKVRGFTVLTPNAANMRLIAAAPAMYEALKAAYRLLREWTPCGEDNQGEVEGLIETALAQAEGSNHA